MKTILLALSLLITPGAFAMTFTISVDGRPVVMKIKLTDDKPTHDPSCDYDREILSRSLDLLDACVRASVNPDPDEVRVPDWEALMGLSAQLARFDLAARVERHVHAWDPSLPWYPAFLAHERELIASEPASFIDVFRERFAYPAREQNDLRDLARRSVEALSSGRLKKVSDWLEVEVWDFPYRTLRPPTGAKRRDIVNKSRPCGHDLGENVILFRPRPR